jgi:hypothetical protein
MDCEITGLEFLSQNKLREACFDIEHLDTNINEFIRFVSGRCGLIKYANLAYNFYGKTLSTPIFDLYPQLKKNWIVFM